MKKKVISLRGLSEILSEKELKNVMGGSTVYSSGNDRNCNNTYCYTTNGNCYYGSDAEEKAKDNVGPGGGYTCNNYAALTKCCF